MDNTQDKITENFLNLVGHEIKTPLTTINIYLELTKRYIDTTECKDAQNYIKKIQEQTNRLLKLSEDLVNIAPIKNQKYVLRYTVFELDKIIEEVLVNTHAAYPNKAIILTGDRNQKVFADRNKIFQVLENIVNNALKFSPKEQKIDIHTSIRNNKIYIEIKDQGVGIEKVAQKKIFNKFYKANTGNFAGLGLGLFYCNQIIRKHGEKIIIESNAGKGTSVTFPLKLYFI